MGQLFQGIFIYNEHQAGMPFDEPDKYDWKYMENENFKINVIYPPNFLSAFLLLFHFILKDITYKLQNIAAMSYFFKAQVIAKKYVSHVMHSPSI